MVLDAYRKKRDFQKTREPQARLVKTGQRRFVVQEHHASRLHYDFRLEMGGVLKSWAVPKGPSLDPKQKHLAVQVEDHPVDYLSFEGEIAEGNYGAGQVRTWDTGTYAVVGDADPLDAYANGKLSFVLSGQKLRGQFNLVKIKRRDDQWLLIKSSDRFAQEGWQLEPILKETASAKPARGRKTEEVAPRRKREPSNAPAPGKARRQATRAKESKKAQARTASGGSGAPRAKSPNASMSLEQFLHERDLSGDIDVNVDGVTVTLSHLDKPFWPAEGYTKGDLLRYYAAVAPTILPYLRDRPLILKRYPNGIQAPFFFQHDMNKAPDYVRTVSLESEEKRALDYAIIDNTAALLYLTNLGTIEEHPWHSRVQDIDHPTFVVLDLDPEDAAFEVVCQVAQAVRQVLEHVGLHAYAKTSGSRGIHIFVPIQARYDYKTAAQFAERVAALVVAQNPHSATVVRSLSRRKSGLVYVDHLQNAKGKTIACPYSVRAHPGATVSAPLEWHEIKKGLDPRRFALNTMLARIKDKGDLFKAVLERPQSLEDALKAVENRLSASGHLVTRKQPRTDLRRSAPPRSS